MSHPLLVEAIEDLFVPVLVHNNRKGPDEEILRRFSEPAWNNPVIRYVNHQGRDLIPRKDGVWTTGQTAARMMAALRAAGKPVPQYLQLVAAENIARTQRATFAMHCYWEGEVRLGSIPGVLATGAAWIGPKEVVTVTFDPQVVKYETLLATAHKMECASTVFAHNDSQLQHASSVVGDQAVRLPGSESIRPVEHSEQKYHLRRTPLAWLPLTPLQQARVNSAIFRQQPYQQYLSPRQLHLASEIRQALERNPQALEGLTAPDAADQLPRYNQELEQRLKEGNRPSATRPPQ